MENKTTDKRIFIVAGERSGDLHGANLIKALLAQDPNLQINCWGGDQMETAGANLQMHYRHLAFMGFWEVFKNLFTISKLLSRCKKDIVAHNPDLVIFIDYPGFNLKLAAFTYKLGIPSYYYIAPKAWAWNEKRVHLLRKFIKRVFLILPFEVDYFNKFGVNVRYVGNPLLNAISDHTPDQAFIKKYKSTETIAVLPGSRVQEVAEMGSRLFDLTTKFPNHKFLVAGVDNLDPQLYKIITNAPNVEVIYNKTYDILSVAHAAIVTSGTATLETALFGVPQLVCYRTSPITYAIAKRLVKIQYISLVNLIADDAIVPELIQHDFSAERMYVELKEILKESQQRQTQLDGYKKVRSLISDRDASTEVANDVIKTLSSF